MVPDVIVRLVNVVSADDVSVTADAVLLGSVVLELCETVGSVNVVCVVGVSEVPDTVLVVSSGVEVAEAVVAVNEVSKVGETVLSLWDEVEPDEIVVLFDVSVA